MSENHHQFMAEAIRLAEENVRTGGGGPFGAVVVKDGKIIARGTNLVTSTNDPTAHAEVVVIREACRTLGSFQLTGCDIYASCEPCPMCLSAIYWARLDALYFAAGREDAAAAGFDDALLYEEVSKDWNFRTLEAEQHLQPEAQEVFSLWKNKPNRVDY